MNEKRGKGERKISCVMSGLQIKFWCRIHRANSKGRIHQLFQILVLVLSSEASGTLSDNSP